MYHYISTYRAFTWGPLWYNRCEGQISLDVSLYTCIYFITYHIFTLQQGYYMRPTVITNVKDESRLMKEEIFGPVTCIVPFDTEEEVRPWQQWNFSILGSGIACVPLVLWNFYSLTLCSSLTPKMLLPPSPRKNCNLSPWQWWNLIPLIPLDFLFLYICPSFL